MKLKIQTWHIIVLVVVSLSICFIYVINDNDEEHRFARLALVDGAISSELKFDMNRVWTNNDDPINLKDDDGNGFIDDTMGWNFRDDNNKVFVPDAGDHGTSIMFLLDGIAPGYCNLLNDTECSIIPIKILSDDEGARIVDLIDAIHYAEEMGAQICNLSIATSEENSELFETIKQSNMLFVVSAGNDGRLIDDTNPVFPAMYDLNNVVTVGSMNADGNISHFSNYSSRYVDVLALGENILSKNSYNEWGYYDGTTYAAVRISALAMKGIVEDDASNPEEIKEYIVERSHNNQELKNYVRYGAIE